MSLDCNQTKERLEELIDQIVDAGLRGKAPSDKTYENDKKDENFKTGLEPSLPFTLSRECQEHLNQCADCRDYQTANRMLIDAAAVLPIQEVPQADLLTASIMQLVMDEPAYASDSQIQASTPAAAEVLTPGKSSREIYLVLISFAAFAATSAYGLQLDESLWNIGSWSLALLLFAALKPLVEQGPGESRALRNIGMPA
ncbi:hypothetical protein BH11CYA1_BH11CYA1_35590 [soil metagenome]